PFVVLEAGLRAFDVGKPTSQTDPLAGFNRQHPLFERFGDVYRTVRSRGPYFGMQEFAAHKPANGFRIFTFGGSTVFGHPYLNDTAFPKWLELELAVRNPSRRVESVNCGGVSYASYRLAPIVREVLQYQPDLIVLAMGHNEFLEDRTCNSLKRRSGFLRWIEEKSFSLRIATCARQIVARFGSKTPAARGEESSSSELSPEVKTRLDDSRTGYASYHRDDAWHAQVVSQFEETFCAMMDECRTAKVPMLVVTLGSSLRDCPPFKSEHKPVITPYEERRWQSAFDAATEAEATNLDAALALYGKAEAIDDQHALLLYRMGRCFDRLGQLDRAREYFLRAKDEDVCPLRMPERIYELEHSIAAKAGTPLVDARKLLESHSPDGIPGCDIYLDHVHPTVGAHQWIAQAIAARLGELRWFPETTPVSADSRRAAYHRHLESLPPSYFTNGRRRVEWLENWARRQKLYDETLPKDARGFLHQGFRQFDFDDEDAAWKSFQMAIGKDSGTARQLARHALELLDQGRPESARNLINRLNQLVSEPALEKEIHNVASALERFGK
ncbi:MAG TPA: hypothetical protein VI454_05335, partial [Verrucomicrobiae bacterium]